MPGVTNCMLGATIWRISTNSKGEQTNPRKPLRFAIFASRRTCRAGLGSNPSSLSAFVSRLVRTVTPSTKGGVWPNRQALSWAACSAALIISRPPLIWMLSICTSNRTAAATAFPTVFGISWNFRSRNTGEPKARIRRTTPGPSFVKSSLPILKPPDTGASCSANFSASSAVGTSSATIIGFRIRPLNLNRAKRTRLIPATRPRRADIAVRSKIGISRSVRNGCVAVSRACCGQECPRAGGQPVREDRTRFTACLMFSPRAPGSPGKRKKDNSGEQYYEN